MLRGLVNILIVVFFEEIVQWSPPWISTSLEISYCINKLSQFHVMSLSLSLPLSLSLLPSLFSFSTFLFSLFYIFLQITTLHPMCVQLLLLLTFLILFTRNISFPLYFVFFCILGKWWIIVAFFFERWHKLKKTSELLLQSLSNNDGKMCDRLFPNKKTSI
jgi:hypothetical protein